MFLGFFGFGSPWPSLLILALAYAAAATPLFAWADSPPQASSQRQSVLDGIRGFLALFVVFHHFVFLRGVVLFGDRGPPHERFYAVLGPFGVSIFFMITGYLFWSQVIRARGRIDFLRLYVGRVFRIGPLFFVAIAMVVTVVAIRSGFRLREPASRVGYELLSWLAPLGFHMGPPLNGDRLTVSMISVIWTLRYEWLFYASLAVTALAGRISRGALILPVLAMAGAFAAMLAGGVPSVVAQEAPFIALFAVGMTCAATPAIRWKAPPAVSSGVASVLFLSVLLEFRTTFAAAQIAMLGAAFLLLTRGGATLFGLLLTRPARRLGNISYGIYLLHLVILVGLYTLPPFRGRVLDDPLTFWSVNLGCALAVIALATLMHAAVERPGIDLGWRVLARLRRLPLLAPAVARDRLEASAPEPAMTSIRAPRALSGE